jgi:hypothetical protein
MKTTSIRIKSDVLAIFMTLSLLCDAATPASAVMDIEQTLSDDAQLNTIAFDGFGIITGTFEAQTFFPPGKLADYWGFQYLRDNTPNGNGHNTCFLTNCAYNILYTLSAEQFAMLKTLPADYTCDSAGSSPKLYTFTLYALSGSPQLPGSANQVTGDVLTQAISSITLGSAYLNLSYTRP